jgi:ABC-type amino acid transport substrate-binding protein
VPVTSIGSSLALLNQHRIDAVLADELQLRYLMAQKSSGSLTPLLSISGVRPELQGFGLSPRLPEATVQSINLAIIQLKRSGVVQQLRQRALGEEPGAKVASFF